MNLFSIEVQSEVPSDVGHIALISEAVRQTLLELNKSPGSGVTVLLMDDARIRELNSKFRGLDEATDVLSFPSGSSTPGTEYYLGDIAISVPTSKRQAEVAGHSFEDELSLLAIHGTLHLLGYDHADRDQKEKMWRVQKVILERLKRS